MALAEEWAVEPPSESYEPLSFQQDIALKPFALLSLKNGLLNLVTLTLYRFWARTEVRRKLWARISLNDEPFEYTGRGVELFIGFLIATAVLGVPFLALVFAIQFLPPMAVAPLLLLLYLGMFVLLGAAIFLAFRYMASRTTWRGIRFSQRGSASDFGMNYAGYLFLTSITLGWYGPAMKMRVAQRLWGDLRFGSLKLRWIENHKEGLYGPFAIGWAATAVAYIAFLVAMFAFGRSVEQGQEPGVAEIAGIYVMLLGLALLVMVAFAPYQAAVLRKIAGSIGLGNARFKLDVKAVEMAGLMLSNVLLLGVSLGLLSPLVQARTARFLVRRLSATGTAPLSWARQATAGPKTGEGLADAFGFSPI